MVRTAVASSVLYVEYMPLIPEALQRCRDRKANIRISLLPAVSLLAALGEPNCKVEIEQLLQDKNKQVRNMAEELYNNARREVARWLAEASQENGQ